MEYNMIKKFLNIFNKDFSIKTFFKRFFASVFLLILMIILISFLAFLNLFSFLEISERCSKTIYEIIVHSFAK